MEELPDFRKTHGPALKAQVLKGEYQPKPVKRVEIPKPGSPEQRKLGIPWVVDRFLQQAVLHTLQPQWDATFSAHS